MRTPEDKLLRAIGSIQDEKLITSTMPKQRRSLFGTERHRLSFVTVEHETVSKAYYIRRAVIGIAAAALVITGAVMLWRYIRYDYVDPDRTDFRGAAYSDYEDLPVLPENGEDDGTGRDNVLLLTIESGDGDSGLEYRVELLADNVYQISEDDPYMLICDPYAVVTDMNTGNEIGTMYFFPGDPLPIMPAKGVKYDNGGRSMDWLRASVEFMYDENGTHPLFITQYAAKTGGMYTTFYGINSDGELQIFTNLNIDKSILSEGNTVGMELSGTNTIIANYYIDLKREITFGFDFENIFIYAYKGTQPPEKPEEPHDPVAGPSELHENSTVTALPVQEKFLSDRLPAAGEGDALDMLVCANGTVYEYISYGRFSYDRALKEARDSSYSREDTITELINGIKAVSDSDGALQTEYLTLLQKAEVRGYFDNEPITDTDFYYIGDNYMISVDNDGRGNGARFLQRLDGKYAWSARALNIRKALELLWEKAAEQPDTYGDMSIVFVTTMMYGEDYDFGLEVIVREGTYELAAYLSDNIGNMEHISVITPEEERAAYMPIGNINTDAHGNETAVDSYNWYGHSFLACDNKAYREMSVHVITDLQKFAELNNIEELKNIDLAELTEITPYEDIFDPVLMPYDKQGHKFYSFYGGGLWYIIETLPDENGGIAGYEVYRQDGQMTIVRNEALWFRLHPVYHESGEQYIIDRLDLVNVTFDDGGDRPMLRITPKPFSASESLLEKIIKRFDFTPYYWEIAQ